MSYTHNARFEYLIGEAFRPDLRAVAEIQRKVMKQGKRNVISRHLHAKNDKEKIAGWKSDLNKILHVFNVRSIDSVWRLLTLHSQTELTINTHVIVSDTRAIVSNTNAVVSNTHAIVSGLEHNFTSAQTMVSEIYRTMVKGQEGSGGNNLPVSDSHPLFIVERRSTLHRLKPGQRPKLPTYLAAHIRI